MRAHNSRHGFTFIELVLALLLLMILAVSAIPSFRAQVARIRARSALDHLVTEIHRARMLAVESGGPSQLILQADRNGCIRRFRLMVPRQSTQRSGAFGLDLPGLCLRQTGDSIITFNSRGILRPPARSLRVEYGAFADSVLLSIAGRVRRSYRRGCR